MGFTPKQLKLWSPTRWIVRGRRKRDGRQRRVCLRPPGAQAPVSKRAAIAAFTVPFRISVGPPGCNQTLFEEPYARNPHVRFCGGADPVTGRPTRSQESVSSILRE